MLISTCWNQQLRNQHLAHVDFWGVDQLTFDDNVVSTNAADADLILRTNGTGTVNDVNINGQNTTTMYASPPSSGSGWDVINYFFYVDGESWNVFGNQVQYSI